jgi:hypothetical protein
MQTGQSTDLCLRETAFISGLISVFVQQVIYDAMLYVLHAAWEESDEVSDASDADLDAEEPAEDEPAAPDDQPDEPAAPDDQSDEPSDEDKEADEVEIPKHIYGAAAKRELLSPLGIVHDLELMYNVQFGAATVSDRKSVDAVYCERVQQVFAVQKQCLAQGSTPYHQLAQEAFAAAMVRLAEQQRSGYPLEMYATPDGAMCCQLCSEMEQYADASQAESGLRQVLLSALGKLL